MTSKTKSSMPPQATIARKRVPGSLDPECEAICDYLKSAHARAHLPTAVDREALFAIITTPFEVSTVEDACRRVAHIMARLREWPHPRTQADHFACLLGHELPPCDLNRREMLS